MNEWRRGPALWQERDAWRLRPPRGPSQERHSRRRALQVDPRCV